MIGTDTAKDRIFARMKIPAPGPGFMHLPDFADDEYLAQLTSEKAVRRYKRGRGTVREYIKTRARNEALDLEVYALAALYVLGQAVIRRLGEAAAALRLPPGEAPTGGDGGQQGGSGGSPGGPGRPGGGSSWVDSWR
jgi:phage terminase large subunit GpA-like protein